MRKRTKFSEIIKGHEDAILKELAERLKDLAFMSAEEKTRESMKHLKDISVHEDDTMEINWRVSFVVNDIIQIIGREERKKKEVKYTFQNSICTLLNEEGRKLIDPQLEKLKCHQCGAPLCRLTFLEGDMVHCRPPSLENWHDTGFEIDVNSDPPQIVEKLEGED